MISADDVWRQSPAFVLFFRASIAAAVATVSAQGIFDFIFLGLVVFLGGKTRF
jgi:hypothetical protein